MHPLLKSFKHILALVASWLPVLAGLAYLHTILAKGSYKEAFILLSPVMALELFIFLSIWFVCKSTPLSRANLGTFLLRHLITIIVMNAIWLHISMLYSEFLNIMLKTTVYRAQFDLIFPVLTVFGFFIYFLAAMLSYLLLALEQAKIAERQALENQLIASQAELRFLKSTIHPHFLFNSLTALGTLTRKSADKAQEVCRHLAEFLRYSLAYSQKELVSIKEEIDHINNYLSVEKMRLGHRLQTHFELDDTLLDKQILSFSLQPLIENAIKHGIEPSIESSEINFVLKKVDDYIFVHISNPANSVDENPNSTKLGLQNLKSRLDKVYKEDAKILVHRGESVFSVKLYLPFLKETRQV
jgi:two-component system, LytTR family, sensor histidine kinase AlgZ